MLLASGYVSVLIWFLSCFVSVISLSLASTRLPACLVLPCCVYLDPCPAMAMSASTTAPVQRAGRFWNVEQPTCGGLQCHGNGKCVNHGVATVCECRLGYTGEFCRDTVNEALSIPLSLGVLGCIIGVVLLAFLFAKLRQKRNAQIR